MVSGELLPPRRNSLDGKIKVSLLDKFSLWLVGNFTRVRYILTS